LRGYRGFVLGAASVIAGAYVISRMRPSIVNDIYDFFDDLIHPHSELDDFVDSFDPREDVKVMKHDMRMVKNIF
jgi:hypothetical protein